LLIGSFCSIGAIGAVNFHMKFVFLDQGFTDRTKEGLALLNSTWRVASMTILATSIAGRLAIGGLADRFSKKWVMTHYLLSGGRHHSDAADGQPGALAGGFRGAVRIRHGRGLHADSR
jgi:hypothetical protein